MYKIVFLALGVLLVHLVQHGADAYWWWWVLAVILVGGGGVLVFFIIKNSYLLKKPYFGHLVPLGA